MIGVQRMLLHISAQILWYTFSLKKASLFKHKSARNPSSENITHPNPDGQEGDAYTEPRRRPGESRADETADEPPVKMRCCRDVTSCHLIKNF